MRLFGNFFLFLFLTISCTPIRHLVKGKNYIDSDGMRQGVWHFSSIHDEEKLESKGRFKNDKPWGRWKYYNEDEVLIRKEKYKRQNREIVIKTKFYHTNGRIEKEGLAKVEYNASNTHYYWFGEWKYYLSHGQLSAIKLFSKGSNEPEILMDLSDESAGKR